MTEKQINKGLNDEQVALSRQKHGSNKMTAKNNKTFFSLFLENLKDPVIRVLILSLIINILFTMRDIDWFETGGIALAILLATTISTLSEHSTGSAFKKLNERSKSLAHVYRNGELLQTDADEIVVGDIVSLMAGDKICADGFLINGSVMLDQSAMTGESKEVSKTPAKIITNELDTTPSGAHTCLRGCLVSSGEGEMQVFCVGDRSYLGTIACELQTNVRESPLKIRLTKLAKQISTLGYAAALIISLLSLFSSIFIESEFINEVIISKLCDPKYLVSELLHSITLGLTVVIMAVPEGLPMMVAVVLSSNVNKMLADNVLVRKQTGIEAAGSMNLLFTDKTGTLTKGKMSVEAFILPDGSQIKSIKELKSKHEDIFLSFCENAINNSTAKRTSKGIVGGNATERALLDIIKNHYHSTPQHAAIKIPFDSKTKISSARVGNRTYIKGAPEIVLNKLSDKNLDIFQVENAISTAQSSGKRVVAMSENGKFTCAIIISDPPKAEARRSVEELTRAGIGVIMITGDGSLTAKSIAEQTGIINKARSLVISHTELESMTDQEVISILPHIAVLSRALPSDKSRLVRLAQSCDLVVGMTGDGINDAPALRLSDVGFAMGSGNDVAKEAGDIVILDNNLSSIVKAVLYGRNIFKSIRKFLTFQLTMNFSSALVCMIAPLLGYETPITVSQMLWVNMIMDTLGGLAFAGEAPHKRIMKEKPKRRDEAILNNYMIHQILISGIFSVIVSLLFLKNQFFTSHFRSSENDLVLLSAFFALLIFLGVVQCINSRTDRLNIFSGISKNPTFVLILMLICVIQISLVYFGGAALRATPLYPGELYFTLLCALSGIPFELLRKMLWRFSGHTTGF